jgi:drug/metabolite transporter (DMT)-like permease
MNRAERLRILAAFAGVYIVWGSTYLAIRFAIETIPPFAMAGVRFLVAGPSMLLIARATGGRWATRAEWRTGAIVGLLLLVGGNGGVAWAEQTVPSGIAALMVAGTPLWITLFDWLRPGGKRPDVPVIVGLVMGFAGAGMLVSPSASDAARVGLWPALALVMATMSWAAGSIVSRHAPTSPSPLMATGVNMVSGGAALMVVSLLTGELSRFSPAAVTSHSLWALGYLIVFGSFVGFTSYIFLLRHVAPAKAATYAYVNPVVAVFLGWLLASEPVTPRVLVGAAVIIAGVIVITSFVPLREALRRLLSARGSAGAPTPER